METEIERAPSIPCGWSSNPAASQAAAVAWNEGKTEEECFEAAKEAVSENLEQVAEEVEQDVAKLDSLLQHEYFQAICNTTRANALSFDDARKAAATLDLPTVSYQVWRRRLGL